MTKQPFDFMEDLDWK